MAFQGKQRMLYNIFQIVGVLPLMDKPSFSREIPVLSETGAYLADNPSSSVKN